MSNNVILPLSNIINIQILPTPQNLTTPDINTVALFTNDQPTWIGSQAFAVYTNASQVGIDFGTSSNSFKIAVAFFAQQPNPLLTQGYLVIIPRIIGSSETVQQAILRTLNSVFYFGILVDEEYHSSPTTLLNLAIYVQSLDKVLFYCSSQVADFQTSGGLLYQIMTAGDNQTRCLYYNDGTPIDTQGLAAAYASRGLSTDFSGSLTAGTMNLKQLAGFQPDQTLTETLYTEAQAAGVDIYPSNAGISGLLTSGANGWFDQIYGQFALKFALQVAGFNYLASTNTKIPQTEAGMTGLKGAYRAVLDAFVTNGFMAPGSWTSPDTFGNGQDLIRSVAGIGYYVYSQPVVQQLPADRNARKAPLIQIAAKLAGAIHSSAVIVNINE
jgi:hypothetical protein